MLSIQISDNMICFIERLQNYGKFTIYCLKREVIARTAFLFAINASRHPSKYIFKRKFLIKIQGYARKIQMHYLLLKKK